MAADVTVTAFDTSTGILTLTADSLNDITKAEFQSMLEAIRYTNSSDTPNTGDRTISWTVNDGTGNSNVGSSTIEVAAANDAPVLGTLGGTLSYTEGDGASLIDSSITLTDVDDDYI